MWKKLTFPQCENLVGSCNQKFGLVPRSVNTAGHQTETVVTRSYKISDSGIIPLVGICRAHQVLANLDMPGAAFQKNSLPLGEGAGAQVVKT